MSEFLKISQLIIHYSLHFFFPGLLALIFFKKDWKIAWLIMISTILVDLDHFLANPFFNPNRCSIGFHPFHSYYAIAMYFSALLIPNKYIKMIAVGLLLHMLTDFQDCLWIKFF